MADELDKPIGTKEQPRLTPGSVIVKDVTIEEYPTKKGGKVKILSLHCKHPDKDELISLTNMKVKKVQGNNETISKDAIWYREQEEEINGVITSVIDLGCNTAKLMKFYKKAKLSDFKNSSIDTEIDISGFLTIKAY